MRSAQRRRGYVQTDAIQGTEVPRGPLVPRETSHSAVASSYLPLKGKNARLLPDSLIHLLVLGSAALTMVRHDLATISPSGASATEATSMRFVSLKSRGCLRLPSDPASRRRPCLPLTVGATPAPLRGAVRVNPRKGLSPSSQRPCWAHNKNPAASCGVRSHSELPLVPSLHVIVTISPKFVAVS